MYFNLFNSTMGQSPIIISMYYVFFAHQQFNTLFENSVIIVGLPRTFSFLIALQVQIRLKTWVTRFRTIYSFTPLGQDLWKRELSTRTPPSIRKVPGTCPQHKIIKLEVRPISSSVIGKNLHFACFLEHWPKILISVTWQWSLGKKSVSVKIEITEKLLRTWFKLNAQFIK